MKKILLCLSLLISGLLNAQNVNIPDANFKAFLVAAGVGDLFNVATDADGKFTKIDTNGDGEIQVSEAHKIWWLNITSQDMTSLQGVESFTNLRSLWARYMPITSINVTPLTLLEEFYCNGNNFTTINISSLVNLKRFNCGQNKLTGLDISGLDKLEVLQCDGVGLKSLDISGHTSLKNIQISDSDLTSIDLRGMVNLEELSINYNEITSIDLRDCTALKVLWTGGTLLSSLDLTGLTTLTEVHCSYTETLTSVKVGNLPALAEFDCTWTNIVEIDLSGCPALASFECASTPELRFVNLKNGPQITYIDTYDNLHTRYLCIDEGEEKSLPEHILRSGVNVNTYCSFTPGGEYNVISGSFTFDTDNNGCDVTDAKIPFAKVAINDGTTTGTGFSTNGEYSFYTQAGTYILTPQFENEWFTASPVTVTFDTVDKSTSTQNFCVTANGVHNDAEVIIVPIIIARPGFDASYKIIYKNKGNQTLSGNVTLTYNDDVLDYISASAEASSSALGSLVWDYTNLLPFESREVEVQFNVNGPTETPAVNIDDVLAFTALITPSDNDETPADNTFNYNPVVIGSFDPNDITCLEGYTVNPNMIGEYLHYNINFENTGTAPATFIVVKNVIDATQFDVNSLQILNASHAIQTRVTGNKVEFIFDDINLAGSGKGNVTFKIKSLSTMPVNSKVTQNANIYFDYNFPVATNNAETVFGVLSTGNITTDNSVSVYPNPSNGMVNIKANTAILSLQLYDVQGRLLQAGKGDVVDISGRSAGLYFLKIQTEKGTKVEKVVKK